LYDARPAEQGGVVPDIAPIAGFLLLRLHVSGLAVPVRILAMVVSGGSVLRGFFLVAVILLLGRLAALFHRCFRLRSRLVLLLAGWLFLFLYHVMSPQKVVGPFIFLREQSR